MGRAHGRILPPPLLPRAARSQLGKSGDPASHLQVRHGVLVRARCRWFPCRYGEHVQQGRDAGCANHRSHVRVAICWIPVLQRSEDGRILGGDERGIGEVRCHDSRRVSEHARHEASASVCVSEREAIEHGFPICRSPIALQRDAISHEQQLTQHVRTSSMLVKDRTSFRLHLATGSCHNSSAPSPALKISSAPPPTAGPRSSLKTTTSPAASPASPPTRPSTASPADACSP
jgi:hypothetical protein